MKLFIGLFFLGLCALAIVQALFGDWRIFAVYCVLAFAVKSAMEMERE